MSGIYRHPPSPHIGGRQPLEPRRLPPSIAAVAEDNPPFGLMNGLWPIIRAWYPEPPKPPVLPPLAPALSAVPENDPPFGMPPRWLWNTLRQWQIVSQPHWTPARVTEEAAAPAPGDGAVDPVETVQKIRALHWRSM